MITAQATPNALHAPALAHAPAGVEHSLSIAAVPEATRRRLVAFLRMPGWPVIAEHATRINVGMIAGITVAVVATLALSA
jgi:hypothetical protein